MMHLAATLANTGNPTIISTWSDGSIRECLLHEAVAIDTPAGLLIPQYEHAGGRRKPTPSISFHSNGQIARIALHEQTLVQTPAGAMPAELITFAESGALRAVFPLNGQLSGYWTEADELALAVPMHFDLAFGAIDARVISVRFHESGSIHSLTFWPDERITIKTPIGMQTIRHGLSLYPDGALRSFEPADPVDLETPVGVIRAFDAAAVGITGDRNSIVLGRDGALLSLATSHHAIAVKLPGGCLRHFTPTCGRDEEDGDLYFQPLKLDFAGGTVRFNNREAHSIGCAEYRVMPFSRRGSGGCSDCASCNKCAG